MVTDNTLTYRVNGMSCEHCWSAVTDEVVRLPGVRTVDVDLDARLVRVSEDGVDSEGVLRAMVDAGYDALPA